MTAIVRERARKESAFHEAGHALLAWRSSAPFQIVSILTNEEEGLSGFVMHSEALHETDTLNRDFSDLTCAHCGVDVSAQLVGVFTDYELRDERDRAMVNIRILYGGVEAAAILTGSRNHAAAHADYLMIEEYFDGTLGYMARATRLATMQGLRMDAHDELETYWHCVEALAASLLDRQTLTESEAVEVMQQAHAKKMRAQLVEI